MSETAKLQDYLDEECRIRRDAQDKLARSDSALLQAMETIARIEKRESILREALERIVALNAQNRWMGGMSADDWTLDAEYVKEIAREALLRASLSEEDEYVYDDAKPLLRSGREADHFAGVNKMVEPIRKLERVIDRLDIVGPGPEDAILIDEGRQAIAILRAGKGEPAPKPEVRSCETCYKSKPHTIIDQCSTLHGQAICPGYASAASGEVIV